MKWSVVISWFVTWVVSGLVFGYFSNQLIVSPFIVVLLLMSNIMIIYLACKE